MGIQSVPSVHDRFRPPRNQYLASLINPGRSIEYSMKPPRVPLHAFPDIVLHADELAVKRHPQYAAAKAGDADAADALVDGLVNRDRLAEVKSLLLGRNERLLPVHALESEGVNEIPASLARLLSECLGLPIADSVVQSNTVGHTGASGFQRLANQALFVGEVGRGCSYLLIDDFIGQGGTLANLIGYVDSAGGHALGATVLTGKPYSAKLAPDDELIRALRDKHGRDFENWWRERFGFGFDCLTRSEARYLEKSADAQAIRNRLIEAGPQGGSGPAENGSESIASAD